MSRKWNRVSGTDSGSIFLKLIGEFRTLEWGRIQRELTSSSLMGVEEKMTYLVKSWILFLYSASLLGNEVVRPCLSIMLVSSPRIFPDPCFFMAISI
ncbi:ORF975 [White spot syndrome virus]|uniref:Wsv336 n=3 Tax=White spot syndrome virus TaxID=342409 RepID=Q8VAR1_WSSVS|nr:wsv336 [Shrimp white spot syndrome virus]AFX59713.1 wsv336 [White spot syndrome virus]AAL33338.1 wsv336 [Shrimp white spot syndrome virus]AAL89260.1 WSSV392 [Shrimp white spot syndrome virus]ATU83684.1 ORF975 [White spot syndrome virus]AWQ60466.1 wsv336 [Shrimp white spot syndrome virus]